MFSGLVALGIGASGDALVAGEGGAGLPIAAAAKAAALEQAQADFWTDVAICVNEEEDGFWECLKDAEADLAEAVQLAHDQFAARLDLLKLVGDGRYDPEIDGDDFTADITNAYFPLVPGRTLVYEAQTDGGLQRVEVTTLNETVVIDGVECRVVRDLVTLDGEVIEDTTDWYSQDEDGNVWYFGEVAMNFADGFLEDIDGSWRTEKDEAKAGIIMLAAPKVDDAYRQEYAIGVAEDYAVVLGTDEMVVLAKFGRLYHCRKTLDATPLEPGAIEHKYYAPGIGFVKQVKPATGEVLELVQIIGP